MTVSAKIVMELRERTGAGMMECKKFLIATDGDIEKAITEMRKAGQAKADKKADRVAAEGVVVVAKSADNHHAVMVEINSETDFVARDENFTSFATKVAETALATKAADVVALSPSAASPEAAAIVTAVLVAQQTADGITDENVAAAVSAAVSAVVTSDPEVVTNPEAITIAITSAVAEVPAPAPEVASAASALVAGIIASVTGVDTVPALIQAQVAVAVATPADADLDAIEARLNAVEPKIDNLLGK